MTMDPNPIRSFIRRELLFDQDAPLGDDDVLFPDVIDSMGLMDLVGFIEEQYGIEIGDDELVVDNFRTMADVLRVVGSKAP